MPKGKNQVDDLDLQMGIAADVLLELSQLLSERGYAEKACEAKGTAEITKEWRREYRKRGRIVPRCAWEVDDQGIWRSQCGNAFEFTHGGPVENGAQYCQYCGKLIFLQKKKEDL